MRGNYRKKGTTGTFFVTKSSQSPFSCREIILNQLDCLKGFSIALSILLIFRIDKFIQEIVVAQKEGYRQVLENTKEIHNTITNLNQQNREYYSLRFSEVQKELSGMKVGLVKIE